MTFIRIKIIQNKRYAYLVKNIWSKRKQCSRQKVIKYLGPVIQLEKQNDLLFDDYYNIKNIAHYVSLFPSQSIFKKMMILELINHGFEKQGNNLIKDNIKINLSKKEIIKGSSNVVLELNEGFLCNYTLTKLYNFKTKIFDTKKEGLNFANTILQSGITLDQDKFVNLFNKIYKKA
jgi:hypothetical protein